MDFRNSFDVIIIGGGILGVSLAYFISSLSKSKIGIIEQEKDVGCHSSSRNTGKVHAPFLYNPQTKKTFAKAAFVGYQMWKKYSHVKNLPFKEDGVLEITTDESQIKILERYIKWGLDNGLSEKELVLLDRTGLKEMEPNVSAISGIYCSRDASVDYGLLVHNLANDCKKFGCSFIFTKKLENIKINEDKTILLEVADRDGKSEDMETSYLINAGGSNSINIAHKADIAKEYFALYFRGDYWRVPDKYKNLTRHSIYSVPTFHDYPFLDPHWIVRTNGVCEVGPNAIPVFGPFAYDLKTNLKDLFLNGSNIIGNQGFWRLNANKKFLKLVINEISNISKIKMINRVKRFLPSIDPKSFSYKGMSGIRSPLIDRQGNFLSDTKIFEKQNILHILNYNSPGATGVLPIAASLTSHLISKGIISTSKNNDEKSNVVIWNESQIESLVEIDVL